MAPRFQWNTNYGYCGEVSFISAGLHFGQYTSQWTVRELLSPGQPQTRASSSLLLGVNDGRAARLLHLDAVPFDTAHQRSVRSFLTWAKERFLRGNIVIMGVYNNVRTLDEPLPGDPDYDHIVPVFGFGSTRPLVARGSGYRATDTLTISDNGLFTVGPNIPYLYTYRFDEFARTRTQANEVGGPVYSLPRGPGDYGTAVRGPADPTHVMVPVRLVSSLASEGVENQPRMTKPPAPRPLTLTAHVRVPDNTVPYRVYLYDDFSDVPDQRVNAHAANAIRSWTIPVGQVGDWVMAIRAMSNDTRVFRVVAASAP